MMSLCARGLVGVLLMAPSLAVAQGAAFAGPTVPGSTPRGNVPVGIEQTE